MGIALSLLCMMKKKNKGKNVQAGATPSPQQQQQKLARGLICRQGRDTRSRIRIRDTEWTKLPRNDGPAGESGRRGGIQRGVWGIILWVCLRVVAVGLFMAGDFNGLEAGIFILLLKRNGFELKVSQDPDCRCNGFIWGPLI
jgi:hypothetical protein